MTKIEFHTEAQSELEDAHAWYRERSELAARAFAAEIDYAIRSISRSPDAWPQTRSNEHRFVFRSFPYSIIYRVRQDEIFITAIAHQKRRPGYWSSR
jgi:plasmid stabilization system protein ParE